MISETDITKVNDVGAFSSNQEQTAKLVEAVDTLFREHKVDARLMEAMEEAFQTLDNALNSAGVSPCGSPKHSEQASPEAA